MGWGQVGTQTGRPNLVGGGGRRGRCLPAPRPSLVPGFKPDEKAIFPGHSWPEYPKIFSLTYNPFSIYEQLSMGKFYVLITTVYRGDTKNELSLTMLPAKCLSRKNRLFPKRKKRTRDFVISCGAVFFFAIKRLWLVKHLAGNMLNIVIKKKLKVWFFGPIFSHA